MATQSWDVAAESRESGTMVHPRHSCPRCGSSVYRVRRRFIDRLLSIIWPVHRYRCASMGGTIAGCLWEGNLHVERARAVHRDTEGPRVDTGVVRHPPASDAATYKYTLAQSDADAERVSVLLIEEDADEAERIRAALAAGVTRSFQVEWSTQPGDALARLSRTAVDVVILDLGAADGAHLKALQRIRQAAAQPLILVLRDAGGDAMAWPSAQGGALVSLDKRHIDAYWLPRMLHCYLRDKAADAALREMDARVGAAGGLASGHPELARKRLDSIGDAVLATNLAGEVTYVNRAAETMTGWSQQDALRCPDTVVLPIIDDATRRPVASPAKRAIRENRTVDLAMDCLLVRRDGSEIAIEDSTAPIHDRQGRVAGAVMVFRDVDQSRAMTRKTAHLTQHDSLTDLPNGALLTERLSHTIGLARRRHKRAALMFIDLDDFKAINDSQGQAAGDQLLQSVAAQLRTCVRATDTICRQGGDEFAVLLSEIEHPRDAIHVADKVLAALCVAPGTGGNAHPVTASIGLSVYPDHGCTGDELMRCAACAMYWAKEQGGNTYLFFEADSR